MKVSDRAMQIRSALQTPAAEDEANEELELLEVLIAKGLGGTALPGVIQAGRVWNVEGLTGNASDEQEARLWAIQHVASSAGVDLLDQNLDGLDEPDAGLSGPGM